MSAPRFAVLGAGGFLGSHLVPALRARFDADIDAVDVNFDKLDVSDPRVTVTRARVEDAPVLRDVVGRCQVVLSLTAIARSSVSAGG